MKDTKYFEESALDLILMAERAQLDFEESFEKDYYSLMDSLKSDIYKFFQKYQKDGKVSYSDTRKYLTAAEQKEFIKRVNFILDIAKTNGYDSSFISEMEKYLKRINITRLETLEVEANFVIYQLDQIKRDDIPVFLSDVYEAVYYVAYYLLGKCMEEEIDFVPLAEKDITKLISVNWAGQSFNTELSNNSKNLRDAVVKLIPQMFARGMSAEEMGTQLEKQLRSTKNQVKAISRTQINYITNQSNLNMFKSVGVSKYQYCAILDMVTSEICRELNGFVGNLSQAEPGVNFPPMHLHCRSTVIPVFDKNYKPSSSEKTRVWRKTKLEDWIKQNVTSSSTEKVLEFVKKYY